MNERIKDPITYCSVYKEIGCAHVDGYLCEVETCPILKKYQCHCYNCADSYTRMTRMIVCPTCGNKRCPHSTDHNNACTNSNEPGQKGSRYE